MAHKFPRCCYTATKISDDSWLLRKGGVSRKSRGVRKDSGQPSCLIISRNVYLSPRIIEFEKFIGDPEFTTEKFDAANSKIYKTTGRGR